MGGAFAVMHGDDIKAALHRPLHCAQQVHCHKALVNPEGQLSGREQIKIGIALGALGFTRGAERIEIGENAVVLQCGNGSCHRRGGGKSDLHAALLEIF